MIVIKNKKGTHIDCREIRRVVAETGNEAWLKAKLRRLSGEEEEGGDEDAGQTEKT